MNNNIEEKINKNQQELIFTNPINHFPVKNKRAKQILLGGFGGLFVLASILLLIINLVITWSAVITHGRAIILNTLPIPLVFSSILFLIGVILILLIFMQRSDGVTLFEKALIHKKGLRKRHWIWQETNRLDTRLMHNNFGSTTIAERIKIIFEGERKQRLVIRSRYQDMEILFNHIRSSILPILYQKARNNWAQGDVTRFHKELSANQNGLIIKDIATPWNQIDSVVIEKRKLKIYTKVKPNKPAFSSRVKHITNLDLFLLIANYQSVLQV